VSASVGSTLPESLRRVVASAWTFRWKVELEAEARFARLAARLHQIGAAATIMELARQASSEERRHADLCAQMAKHYGEPVPTAGTVTASEIAPSGLLLRGRVLYEMVAACCITETESIGVLTTLLRSARSDRMRRVLHELAEDEVGHSRLGWAHLASEHAQGATSFLGPFIPSMLEGSIDEDLFLPVSRAREDEALLDHGVLPHTLKREVFTGAMEDVVFPGLERFGVDTAAARSWLEGKRASLREGAPPAGRR
jgi:rubrerythrin